MSTKFVVARALIHRVLWTFYGARVHGEQCYVVCLNFQLSPGAEIICAAHGPRGNTKVFLNKMIGSDRLQINREGKDRVCRDQNLRWTS